MNWQEIDAIFLPRQTLASYSYQSLFLATCLSLHVRPPPCPHVLFLVIIQILLGHYYQLYVVR